MKIEDTLEEIKRLVVKNNKEIEELKNEVQTLECQLNSQNSKITSCVVKINEIQQANVDSATLLEEIAYSVLEENKEQKMTETQTPKLKDIQTIIHNIDLKEKYVN